MKERIISILFAINKGIFEKDTELSMSLLAALAGESVILLGPPGVAKSMIASLDPIDTVPAGTKPKRACPLQISNPREKTTAVFIAFP